MFSTLISGVLFALLILETPAMVSALPTCSITTATITSARLKTSHASDSNRNNNDNSHGNGNGNDNNLVPPNDTATSKFKPPPYQSVMSSTREFAVHAMLSPFDERDNSENSERGNNDMSPGEILAIVMAALTLLVGIIPLLRCSRFRHWVSSISPTVKKALGIKLPNPAPTTLEDPSAIPTPIPHSLHIHNNHFNIQLIGASSNTPLCSGDGIGGEGSRVPQVGESLTPRRPERAATCPPPLRLAMGVGDARCSLE